MGKPNNKKTYPSLEKLFEMWESDFSDLFVNCESKGMNLEETYIFYKNWKREQKLNKLLND